MESKEYFLKLPDGIDHQNRLVLHSCCAPCSIDLIERIVKSGIDMTIFFYNPNIHPKKEYEIRKNENKRFAEKIGVKFVDYDYNVQDWFKMAKGMENEPERGVRCSGCFDMRFEVSAVYAKENGFKIFSSSLGISRWKDMDQINRSGIYAANKVGNVEYWTYNWRKVGGSARMYELSKRENFYQQQYCGCIYSLRDSNEWRVKNGREEIQIGEDFY